MARLWNGGNGLGALSPRRGVPSPSIEVGGVGPRGSKFRPGQLKHSRQSGIVVPAARGVAEEQQFRSTIVDESGRLLLTESWLAVDRADAIIIFQEDDLLEPFTVQELIDFGHDSFSNGWWFITRNAPGVPLFVVKYSPSLPELIETNLRIEVINPSQAGPLTVVQSFAKWYELAELPETVSEADRR